MSSISYESNVTDDNRRERLYGGEIFVYQPRPETLALVEHARSMIEEAFAPHDPELAQFEMPVERFAQILGKLKPAFIHEPESKALIQAILKSYGCHADDTHFEVPKLRSSTSDGYLTSGIAYAWHPHRDTWYSAPQCQLNWWIPVYDIEAKNCMAFHPEYFSKPLENSSRQFNYYKWNASHRGAHVTTYLKSDPRPLPGATHPIDRSSEERLIVPVGALIIFSGAHLHSSVPNTSGRTRFSIDFRTVNNADLESGAGAKNVDSECTGTVLREFMRSSDLSYLSDKVVKLYEDGTEEAGQARFPSDKPA